MPPLTQFEIDGNWTSVDDGDLLLQQIADETEAVISVIGRSVLEKNLYALTIGNGDKKLLITSGVHGTEPASREVVLMKARDICYNADGEYFDFLTRNTVMFVPTVNPDRMFRSYRNEDNIDINRVIYHLDSPEGVAYLETLLNTFKADVHFDFHEHSGQTDKDILYVFPMRIDPNSDPTVRETHRTAIDATRSKLESEGITTDYYFERFTGFGSLTSGAGILGKIAITSESSTEVEPSIRVDAQNKSFQFLIEWFNENHITIENMQQSFSENHLQENDTFILLQGMNKGAEMYSHATHVPITCPIAYKINDIIEFQDFIDIYNIVVDEDNIVPINQPASRMIPHLLDPLSDMKVASATRIASEPVKRTDGRYTKVLYDEWREVFIKYM